MFDISVFTPQPLRAVQIWFLPLVCGWAGVWTVIQVGLWWEKSFSGMYLRNHKVW